MTHICNLSLQEGVFPDEMKIANVIPLFKSEDPQMLDNYRPVSVLCALSKVFEKIMYYRLLNYLDEQIFFLPSVWISETSLDIHGFNDSGR